MASVLAILLFGIIKINGQGIPPPQMPQIQPVAVAQPPVSPPPPPPGYQGIGCPNKADACPAGKYRYDAVKVGAAIYGCHCTCVYTFAQQCQTNPTKLYNWDTCSCDNTPAPTTAPPTTSAPTTAAPTTPAPTFPAVFPQPGGGGSPPIAPLPGQGGTGGVPPAPGSWAQPPGPPMGGPGQLPGWNVGPAPAVPVPATTWAPGSTGAPIDELCGANPFNVLSFRRVGNFISLEMECVVSTTTSTSQPPI